jgi:hypothetical protein
VYDLLADDPLLVVMGDFFSLGSTLDEMEFTAGRWVLLVTSSFCFYRTFSAILFLVLESMIPQSGAFVERLFAWGQSLSCFNSPDLFG